MGEQRRLRGYGAWRQVGRPGLFRWDYQRIPSVLHLQRTSGCRVTVGSLRVYYGRGHGYLEAT